MRETHDALGATVNPLGRRRRDQVGRLRLPHALCRVAVRVTGLAAQIVLAVPVRVTSALAMALSAAVLATSLTAFSPFFSAITHRRRSEM